MTSDKPFDSGNLLPRLQEPMDANSQASPYHRSNSPSLTSPTASFTRPLNLRSTTSPIGTSSSTGIRGQTPAFPASPTVFFHHHNLDSSSPISLSAGAALDTPPSGLSYNEYIRTWTDAHVARWLADIRCSSYAPVFKENDIRGDILLDLDNTTLREMGIGSIGDRLRIVNGVKMLRQRAAGNVGRSPTPEPREPQPRRPGPAAPIGTLNGSPSSTSLFTEERVDTMGATSPQHAWEEDDASPLSNSSSHSSGGASVGHDPDDSSPIRRQPSRPTPLQLDSDPKLGPSITRGAPPSSYPSSRGRPLPQPTTGQPSSGSSSGRGHAYDNSSSNRINLPPLPPPPRGQPPAPPSRFGNRTPYTPGVSNSGSDRSTPEIITPGTGLSSSLFTPNTASTTTSSAASSAWTGSQGSLTSISPPTSTTGGSLSSSGDATRKLGPRSPSPLSITRPPPPRSSSTHTPVAPTSSFGPGGHHRKAASQTAPSVSHNYFSDPPVTQSPKILSALRPLPVNSNSAGLSPIVETHPQASIAGGGGNSSGTSSLSSSTSHHSPSNASIDRSYQNTPSLVDLKRKLVKFLVPDSTVTSNSIIIDVATCSSGYEVLEKALKKLGRGGSSPLSPPGSSPVGEGMYNVSPSAATFTPEGGLLIDGWGAYFRSDGPERGLVRPDQRPISDVEILSVCFAPPTHPIREKGLVLKRNSNALSRWDGPSFSPLQDDDERSGFTTSTPMIDTTFKLEGGGGGGLKRRNTKRASAISVLSGLGVRDLASAFGGDHHNIPAYTPHRSPPPIPESNDSTTGFSVVEPSPTKPVGEIEGEGKGDKEEEEVGDDEDDDYDDEGRIKPRSFLGNRPPSELITNHLEEFFPFTEKKVLDRTSKARSRQSLMKRGTMMSFLSTSDDSDQSYVAGGGGRASISTGFIPPVPQVPLPPPPPVPTGGVPQKLKERPMSMLSVMDKGSKRKSVMVSGPPRSFLPPIVGDNELEGDQKRRKRGTRMMSISNNILPFPSALGGLGGPLVEESDVTVDAISAEVEQKRDNSAASGTTSTDDDEWTRVDGKGEEEEGKEPTGDSEEEEEEEEETFKWIKGALIGSGSFGKVYLGMDASSGFLLAVKQIPRPEEGASASVLASLESEIDLLRDLQHEKIVQYYHSSMDDEYLNIFLEYVPGGSVTALLRNYGAFEEPLVKNFVKQILEGLNYLHEKGIIHRDIKGGNVLVDNKGGIKISDFGVSKKVENGTMMPGKGAKNRASLQGSVFWMAPEVVKQTVHTKKADIWSLGCLTVEMLTGDHPWGNLSQMQAIFKIGSGKAKPTLPSDISSDAQDFLEKTFELDYMVRPSAAELLSHCWVALKKQSPFFRRPSHPAP